MMWTLRAEATRAKGRCSCLRFSTASINHFGESTSTALKKMANCHLKEVSASLLFVLFAIQCWAAVELKTIGPGVYVVVQPFADRFNDSNSTIVVMKDAVLVVDTQCTLTEARSEVEAIKHLTNKPVRWVVNTHWHNDHIQGNQVYRDAFPGVKIIAQVNTRKDMEARATRELSEQIESLPGELEYDRRLLAENIRPGGSTLNENQRSAIQMRIRTFSKQLPDLRQTHIVLPDITFDDSMSLYTAGREIRLMHFLGHTKGDVVVFLPDYKILITGDLLDDMPYTGDGSPMRLVETLSRLDALNFDFIVPGHGGIENGHEHLRLIASLFKSINSQVAASFANGRTLSETTDDVKVDDFRGPVAGGEVHATRAFDAFVRVAIERAFNEAKAAAQLSAH